MSNAEAFVAQRRTVVEYLRSLPESAWTDEVTAAVSDIVSAYRDALGGTNDETLAVADDDAAGGGIDELEQIGPELEATYAQESDERWDRPTEELRTRHPIGIGVQTLMYDVHRRASEISRATGVPFTAAADVTAAVAAAVVWRVAGHVEVPVRVVVRGGADELMLGGGEPEGTLRTDHDAIVAVATGHASVTELEQQGRWQIDGSDELREAVARSFSADWGDPEVSVTDR